jgi:hypothetical protein
MQKSNNIFEGFVPYKEHQIVTTQIRTAGVMAEIV